MTTMVMMVMPPVELLAGRLDEKDFSCSDRKFGIEYKPTFIFISELTKKKLAFNIGIPFSTPEEFFFKEAASPFSWDSVDLSLQKRNHAKGNRSF